MVVTHEYEASYVSAYTKGKRVTTVLSLDAKQAKRVHTNITSLTNYQRVGRKQDAQKRMCIARRRLFGRYTLCL